jgi:hypothetical protein
MIACHVWIEERRLHHVLLNPGEYTLKPGDDCFFIGQDHQHIQQIQYLNMESYLNSLCHDELESERSLPTFEVRYESCIPVQDRMYQGNDDWLKGYRLLWTSNHSTHSRRRNASPLLDLTETASFESSRH